MALDEPKDSDRAYETEGLHWLVAEKDHDTIMGQQGLHIDHVTGWFGSGFSISKRGAPSSSCC